MWFSYVAVDWFWSWSKLIVFMNHVHIHSLSSYQDSYFICWFQLSLYWVLDSWKQVIFSQIILKTTESEISLLFIHHLCSWASLVIIMWVHQTSDLACQINMWSWNQIMTSTQLIMSVNASIISWSWNTADSCDSLKSSWEILILQVLIIIIQSIILLWAILYHRSHSLIQQHSVFVKRR